MSMRKKGHSTREMAICLDHFDPPGILKQIVYFVTQKPLDWMLTRNNCFAKYLIVLVIAVLPVIRITLFTWDFSKDTAILVYLYLERWDFIEFSTIHNLIVVYGVSIFTSSLALCFNMQMTKDNGIIKLNKITNGPLRRIVRMLLLVCTPVVPLRYAVLSVESVLLYISPQHHIQVCWSLNGDEDDGG